MLLLPGYFLTDQPTDGTRFLQFWFICLLVSAISHNQGLAVGALLSNPQVSIHTHNYTTHLEIVIAVVLSGPYNRTFGMEWYLEGVCLLNVIYVIRRI
jgi:hypothetical protein